MEVITPDWKTASRTTENFFQALHGSETTDMGSIGAFIVDIIPLEIPPGRSEAVHVDHTDYTVVVLSFLRVLFFLLAQHDSGALVTVNHPVVWCDWSSSRD